MSTFIEHLERVATLAEHALPRSDEALAVATRASHTVPHVEHLLQSHSDHVSHALAELDEDYRGYDAEAEAALARLTDEVGQTRAAVAEAAALFGSIAGALHEDVGHTAETLQALEAEVQELRESVLAAAIQAKKAIATSQAEAGHAHQRVREAAQASQRRALELESGVRSESATLSESLQAATRHAEATTRRAEEQGRQTGEVAGEHGRELQRQLTEVGDTVLPTSLQDLERLLLEKLTEEVDQLVQRGIDELHTVLDRAVGQIKLGSEDLAALRVIMKPLIDLIEGMIPGLQQKDTRVHAKHDEVSALRRERELEIIETRRQRAALELEQQSHGDEHGS